MKNLETPTHELVNGYLKKFDSDKRYKPADDAITKLFKAFPENKELEDIILKISVINDMYSTNILGTFRMAEHILRLDIDEDLKEGVPSLVHTIATGHNIRTKRNNTEINFYSFATKYCSWHNPDEYAIYDSFVERVLMAYKRKERFSKFKKSDLKVYKEFLRIVTDFKTHYNLTNLNLKDIDKFLWIYGKENFEPNY